MKVSFLKLFVLIYLFGLIGLFEVIAAEEIKWRLRLAGVEIYSANIISVVAAIVLISVVALAITIWDLARRKVNIYYAKLHLLLINLFIGLCMAGIFWLFGN